MIIIIKDGCGYNFHGYVCHINRIILKWWSSVFHLQMNIWV